MKQNPHVIGIDDAPFTHGQKRVDIVGVLVKAPMYVERVVSSAVDVDGADATDALVELVSPGIRETAAAVMLDGICLGGFNVVDLEALHEGTGLPVISVSVKEPDLDSMARALEKHFPDWERRMELVRRVPLFPVKHGKYTLHCSSLGMDEGEAGQLIGRTTVQGAIPEPIRLAHVIAGGTLDRREIGPQG